MGHLLSSELTSKSRFLLDEICGSAAGSGGVQQLPFSGEELIAEAQRQLIDGLLLAWASRQEAGLRQRIKDALRPTQTAQAQRAMTLVAETARLVTLLQANGMRAVALKGTTLSRQLYGDFATRHAGDIDLLVAPDSVRAADALLQAHGYTRTKPQRPLSPARFDLYARTQHEFGYRSAAGTVSLELHWRYADCPLLPPTNFDELWSGTERLDVGGRQVPVLGPADTLVQLAIHGVTDGWSRLKWIADLPRAIARVPPAELARLREDAAAQGYGRVFELALVLGSATAPADVPPWLSRALRYIAQRLESPHPRTFTGAARVRHSLAANRFMLDVFDRGALRRSIAYCNLIMPADFDRLDLPDALTPVLPFVAQASRALRVLRSVIPGSKPSSRGS